MRPLAILASLLLPSTALAGDPGCQVKVGPGDLARERGDLVVEAGQRAKSAVALHGSVVVRAGAVVEDAVALGGDVTVEPGARVAKNAVSVGGDVRVRRGGRVGKDAVSIGGKVNVDGAGAVAGHTLSLALDWKGGGLAEAILSEVQGSCRVTSE